MSCYLTVTIDVEEDMPNWGIEDETTIRNLERIPLLQELFDKYGVRPTYLLNYPFASNEKAVKVFQEIDGRCEIGCHMHNWNTPPLEPGEDKKIEYPSNLPYERQFEKIKTVTETLEAGFGCRPVSYRAGKFGFNADSRKILARLGYKVDTSISPMVSWTDNGGPDFTAFRAMPFWFEQDGKQLLEVPVTVGLTKNVPEIIQKLYLALPRVTKIRGLLSRDYLGLLDLLWLYPALFSAKDMITLAKTMLAAGQPVLNVFFHSSEVKPGESIYTKTEEEANRYLERLAIFFDYVVNEAGVTPATLSEFRSACEKGGALPPAPVKALP